MRCGHTLSTTRQPCPRKLQAMSDYRPIRCELHDVLESLATTRKHTEIEYRGADGALCKTAAVIQDLYARDGARLADF
jgi:hypothetical protein